MSTSTSKKGSFGEEIASKYLQNKGYKIISRNYRLPRWGEIDIIAMSEGYLCVVEVRSLHSGQFEDPILSVTENKKRILLRSAKYFLENEGKEYSNLSVRIEFVGVKVDVRGKKANIQHLFL